MKRLIRRLFSVIVITIFFAGAIILFIVSPKFSFEQVSLFVNDYQKKIINKDMI